MPSSCTSTEWSGEKMPTASVPQMPQVRCTEIAPTGSSIWMRSKNSTENTTSTPAIMPIAIADHIAIRSAPAVMPTRPARMPFRAIERSGFWNRSCEASMAPSPPAAAARQVVTSVSETSAGSADSTEPPLKPNQPSQSRKTPTVASGRLLPGIGDTRPFTNLPRRGPSIQAPTNAAQPPTECTSVEPAKS